MSIKKHSYWVPGLLAFFLSNFLCTILSGIARTKGTSWDAIWIVFYFIYFSMFYHIAKRDLPLLLKNKRGGDDLGKW